MRPLWAEARVPDTLREWIAPIVTLIGGTGLGALIQAIRKPSSKAEDVASEAAADAARTEGFVKLLERVERRLEKVEAEAERCQAENDEFRRQLAQRDATIGELTDRIRRLEAQLEARDITDAAESLKTAGYAVIEKGRTTVMRPPRKPRKTQ